jgi:lysophospholipase L1-like esterase
VRKEDLILPYKLLLAVLSINLWFTYLAPTESEAGRAIPINLFNIGNSIGEGEAADGIIGLKQHDVVWSTGYNLKDIVVSLNERFEAADPAGYYENNAARDADFNQAVSGSEMDDFVDQANGVIAAADQTPANRAGLVAILLGNNDVCASSLDAMTPPEQFERQYRAGLDVLARSTATKNAHIHVSSIPAIYWLWEAMRNNDWCRFVAWPFVPCQNLLDDPINDCGSGNSHLDPDTIHADDGPECIRRKQFHAKIRDIYNPILRNVLKEYKGDGRLPNAYYVDIFDIQFGEVHVNDGDCFHPSTEGHALLADEQWCRSPWGRYDPSCGRLKPAPWIPLLLLDN